MFLELKKLLLARDYKQSVINSAMCKARKVLSVAALRKVQREETKGGPVFVITYDPRQPPIDNRI